MARRTYQQDYGWGSVLPAGTAQPDLPPAEVYGPAVILTSHREVPLSERRMVLYTYSAPDVIPADPCNKMPWEETRPSSANNRLFCSLGRSGIGNQVCGRAKDTARCRPRVDPG